jgi:hypothetical protein
MSRVLELARARVIGGRSESARPAHTDGVGDLKRGTHPRHDGRDNGEGLASLFKRVPSAAVERTADGVWLLLRDTSDFGAGDLAGGGADTLSDGRGARGVDDRHDTGTLGVRLLHHEVLVGAQLAPFPPQRGNSNRFFAAFKRNECRKRQTGRISP